MKRRLIWSIAGMAFVVNGTMALASQPSLKVGDQAPAFKVGTWLKGEPVTEFEKGKVYVV